MARELKRGRIASSRPKPFR